MISKVELYYHALETNNTQMMDSCLHKEPYGLRVYTEDKFFYTKDFYEYVQTNTITSHEITNIKEQNNIITCHVTLHLNNEDIVEVDAKFTFRDGFIDKVYETLKSPLKRIQCILSYDGYAYSGFQKQQNATSIQQTIEESINQALKTTNTTIHSSGRTDKGVHALYQVFHFDTDTSIPATKLSTIINNYLPDDIYIKSSKQVENTHHSRFDVTQKEYMYLINTLEYNVTKRNYEWYVQNLDVQKLESTLQDIIGTHDFSSFTTTSTKSNYRTIDKVEIINKEGLLEIHIAGNGFLRYMVRYIVGAAVHITQGKLPYTMKELLLHKDVNLLKDKAPASGLYLYNVEY